MIIHILSSIVALELVFFEQRKILRLLKTFTEEQIQEIVDPIFIDNNREAGCNPTVQIDKNAKHEIHKGSFFAFFIMQMIFIVLIVLFVYNSSTWVKSLDKAFDWAILSTLCLLFMIEAIESSTLSVLLRVTDSTFDPSTFLVTTSDAQVQRWSQSIKSVVNAHNQLVLDADSVEACQGLDDELDLINSLPRCSITNEHETFKCGSFQQVVNYIHRLKALIS